MVDYTQYAAQRREEQERRRLPALAPVQGRVVQPEPKGPSSKDQLYAALIQTAAGLVRAGGEAAMQYGVQTALGEQRHGQRLTEITKEDEFATGRATVRSKHEIALQKDRLQAQMDQIVTQTMNAEGLSKLDHTQQIALKDHEQQLKIDFWNLTRPKGKRRGKLVLYNGNLVSVKDLEKRRDFHIKAFKKVGDQVYGLENRKEAMDIQAALDQAFKEGRIYNGVKHAQKSLKRDQDEVSAWNFGTGPLREIVGEGAVPRAEIPTGKTSTGKPRYVTEAGTGIDESTDKPPPTPAAAKQDYDHAHAEVREAKAARDQLKTSLMNQGYDPEGADSHLMDAAKQNVANKVAIRSAKLDELLKQQKAREQFQTDAGRKKKSELGQTYGTEAQEDIEQYNQWASDPSKRPQGVSHDNLLKIQRNLKKLYPEAHLRNPVPDAPQGTSVKPSRQEQIAASEAQTAAAPATALQEPAAGPWSDLGMTEQEYNRALDAGGNPSDPESMNRALYGSAATDVKPNLNLTINDGEVHQLLTFLGESADVNIVASDDAIGKMMSTAWENKPWEDALRETAEAAGLTYEIDGNDVTVGRPGSLGGSGIGPLEHELASEMTRPLGRPKGLITIGIQDADPEQMLGFIFRGSGVELDDIVGIENLGNITLWIEEVPPEKAFNMILKSQGMRAERIKGKIHITPATAIEEKSRSGG